MYDNLFSCAVGENIYLLTYLLTYLLCNLKRMFAESIFTVCTVYPVTEKDSQKQSSVTGEIMKKFSNSKHLI